MMLVFRFGLLVVLVSCAGRAGQSQGNSRFDAPTLLKEHIPTEQLQLIISTHAMLGELAKRSELAREMYEFWSKNAVPATYDTSKPIDVPRLESRNQFYVAADTYRDERAGFNPVFRGGSCRPVHKLIIRNYAEHPVGRALMVLHDLSHVWDCTLHNEEEGELMSDRWFVGELEAYRQVRGVLNQITNSQWSRLVAESRQLREWSAVQRGLSPNAITIAVLGEDLESLDQLFPGVDGATLSYLVMQLDVDANLFNVAFQARRVSLSAAAKRMAEMEVMRAFFKTVAESK